jgi:hypothetical protein
MIGCRYGGIELIFRQRRYALDLPLKISPDN